MIPSLSRGRGIAACVEGTYRVRWYGIAMVKVTFTLDEGTVKRIESASQRLSLPKSQVVREAVQDYYECIGRMGEEERLRMLRIFDEVIPRYRRVRLPNSAVN